jgi:hypothetical protein
LSPPIGYNAGYETNRTSNLDIVANHLHSLVLGAICRATVSQGREAEKITTSATMRGMESKRDWTIAAIFVLIVALGCYVWAYKARCHDRWGHLDQATNDTVITRNYESKWEKILFAPAAALESFFSHDRVDTGWYGHRLEK